MRARDFITEIGVTPYEFDSFSLKEAAKILDSKCALSAEMLTKPIWRGMRNHTEDVFSANPSSGLRKSQNTLNFYTTIISESPYMEGWPKRNASFICSTDSGYAREFSFADQSVYAIFPMTGTKIAMCPYNDIWRTDVNIPEFRVRFSGKQDNLSNFNEWLADKFNITRDDQLLPYIITENGAVRQFCMEKKVDPKNFLPIIQKALSPQKTGFRLLSVQEYLSGDFANNECWIGGPVVAVSKTVVNQLGKQK